MNFIRALLLLFSLGFVTLSFHSCANEMPPTGGPIDTVPPTIISTYPDPYTLHFADDRIRLEFDKYVEHRSVEESIFISPYVGELNFDWSGKEVEISFSEKLKKNKTYVVNIGTDVKDLRNQNRMAQAFTLAFSTGDDIDHGAIRGRVYPLKTADPSEGVMIFVYQLEGLDPDTVNPRTLKPDYITQTGKGGGFFLRHLAFGPYRLIAVRDEYRNLLYDPEVDEFGVPSHDLLLTPDDTLQDNVLMQLAREDTTSPRLVKVDTKDVHHLLLDFSEPMDTSLSTSMDIVVLDTLTGNVLKTRALMPNLPKLSSFTIVTERQDSTKGYLVEVKNARDLVGLSMNRRANALAITGASKTDSSLTRISTVSIRDSSREIPLDAKIEIQFSDAVQRQTFLDAFSFRDSAGKAIPFSLHWSSDAVVDVASRARLQSKCWYGVSLLTVNALDWSGRKIRDSVRVIRFETLDAEILSSIEGTIVDKSLTDARGEIYVIAETTNAKEHSIITTIATPKGTFTFPEIQEGRYVLRAFRDRNANGKFDSGKPFPLVNSERFSYAPDTLKVRARWPLEGVRLELK